MKTKRIDEIIKEYLNIKVKFGILPDSPWLLDKLEKYHQSTIKECIEVLENLKALNLESIDTADTKGYFLKSNLELRNNTLEEAKQRLNKLL